MSDKTQYQVTIGGEEFIFAINNRNIEQFINSLDPDNKTVAINNFLVSTVSPEQRECFVELIKNNVLLMMKVFEQFSFLVTTDVEVVVKKL